MFGWYIQWNSVSVKPHNYFVRLFVLVSVSCEIGYDILESVLQTNLLFCSDILLVFANLCAKVRLD